MAPEYGHLVLALVWLYAAVRYTFSRQFFGIAPHWPFLMGGYRMSPFSRWLQFGICLVFVIEELARGLFHWKVTLTAIALYFLCLVVLFAAYRHDRRRSRSDARVP